MERLAAEIEQLVENLDYDFNQFELNHFLRHVESVRRREIILVPYPFDPTVYGLWIPVESADYIFYNGQTHPTHQTHIILHEIGHMLLDHPLHPVDQILPPELIAQLSITNRPGLLRKVHTHPGQQAPEERECEVFVACIQQKIVEKQRLHELTGASSSLPILRRYTDAMSDLEASF